MVALIVVMQESSSYLRILESSGDEREYMDMENLKPRAHPMSVALHQMVQPNALQQNAYYDLMPVSS